MTETTIHPVDVVNVVESDRIGLRGESGIFEIEDRKTGQTLGTLRHPERSANRVEIYHGKGGLTGIISSPEGLKYFALPGSRLRVGETELQLQGEPIRTNPSKKPSSGMKPSPQAHCTQATILGAGLATRFEPISGNHSQYSKPAVFLGAERSVIRCIADHLARHGFHHLIVNTFFKPESLKAALAECEAERVSYIDEDQPSDTAGGLRKMLLDPDYQTLIDATQPLLVIQGDAVTDADLSALMDAHIRENALVTIGCQQVDDKDVDKFGIIVTDCSGSDGVSGNITGFQEKPKLSEAKSRLGNTGFYIFSPQAYPMIREIYEETLAAARQKAQAQGQPQPDEAMFDFATDIFSQILSRVQSGRTSGKFWAQQVAGYWSDIGNPAQYLESVHDVYAGKANLGLPADVSRYYRNGVIFWPGTQEKADREATQLDGNIVVALPFRNA